MDHDTQRAKTGTPPVYKLSRIQNSNSYSIEINQLIHYYQHLSTQHEAQAVPPYVINHKHLGTLYIVLLQSKAEKDELVRQFRAGGAGRTESHGPCQARD